MSIEIGKVAPDFCLPSNRGEVCLSQWLKRGPVLLVFYPGDETAVCTRQLCDYRDHPEVFAELGVQVLAINPQPLDSHASFAARHALPFPLLSDADAEVCRAYGALGLLGIAKRALVLVGEDGVVRWRRNDLPLFYRGAQELRELLAELE